MEYTQRLHQFTRPKTWQLEADRLKWHDDKGASGEVLFKKIKSIRLRFEPSRTETNRYAMHINNKQHTITNINYRGPMDFKDQSGPYCSFIQSFHASLAKVNPDVRYDQGSTKGAYIGNILACLFAAAAVIFSLLFFAMSGVVWIALAHMLFILFFFPVALRVVKRNKPGTYTPDDIPQALLPDI